MKPKFDYYNNPSSNTFLNNNPLLPYKNQNIRDQQQEQSNYQKESLPYNNNRYVNQFVTNVNLKSTMTQQEKVIAFGQGRDENLFKQTLRRSIEPTSASIINKRQSYNIITNLPINNNNFPQQQKVNDKGYDNSNNYNNQRNYQQGAQRNNQHKSKTDVPQYQYGLGIGPGIIRPKATSLEKTIDDQREYYESSSNCIPIKEYAYIEDQNAKYRNYMEDKGFSITNFNNTNSDALFGIFDGHGGVQVSQCLQDILPSIFKSFLPSNNIQKSFISLFDTIDLKISKERFCDVGSTACIVYFTTEFNKKILYSANVGDTRSLLISQFGFKRLSYDHRSSDKLEHERIIKSGGVIFDGRLYGQLMLSRSIGDWKLKSSGLISTPHVTRIELSSENKYVIIASDGIFDVLEDEDVYQISLGVTNANDYVKKIVNAAFSKGAVDNISCFAIRLN